jgi:hypothetical protein
MKRAWTVFAQVNTESRPGGPRTGEVAPDFTLSKSSGNKMNLADELWT